MSECLYQGARLEDKDLTKGITQLNQRLTESEDQRNTLEDQIKQERLAADGKIEEYCAKLKESEEQLTRLKESYDEVVEKNQELESRILQLSEELEAEKQHSDEVLATMTERLMDTTENMNKMEKETAQNRNDCNLVVQLLKCNQSLDKTFVTKKVNTFPCDLKAKLSKELDLQPSLEQHPPWSKKRWQRSKSSTSYPGADVNGNANALSRRTKSVDEHAALNTASADSRQQATFEDSRTETTAEN